MAPLSLRYFAAVSPYPFPLASMAPTLVCPPFHRDGWVYEEKVDGWRIVVYKNGSRVRLTSGPQSSDRAQHPVRRRRSRDAVARVIG